MAINQNKLREKLNKLQSGSGGNFEKIDYKALYFKPQLGKQVVRIVPFKFDPEIPYKEILVHSYNAFRKTIYALSNWGEKDPIQQFIKQLYNEDTEENKAVAKKIKPRKRYFFQVIVRGQEHLGVRLWEVGPATFEKLLTILSDEEYGDVTDIVEGTDLTVEGFNATMEGSKKTYIDVNITPKRKPSELSDDPNFVEKWLNEQKDPLELSKKYTYDELKQILRDYLDPKEKTDDDDEELVTKSSTKEVAKGAIAKIKTKVLDDDNEDETPAPTKAKVKTKPVVVEADDDGGEDEIPTSKVKKTPTATKPSAKKPVVDLISEDVDESPFTDDDDELLEVTKKSSTKSATSKASIVVKSATKPTAKTSAAAKFAAAFDDDEE